MSFFSSLYLVPCGNPIIKELLFNQYPMIVCNVLVSKVQSLLCDAIVINHYPGIFHNPRFIVSQCILHLECFLLIINGVLKDTIERLTQ